ncbi:uncharacterized protein LOC130948102 isoform X1 [Arachis stenosperma]|uniref:uncharacterized protein LOC130948102 isoform X1 n=1 Tax=Arachis stenosperma TaxID=217475 RepID=UPI0025AD31D8|nr:uncharacterized protein LOC130948102 isoform X1 [Arachis stenosperma]
MLKLLRQRLSLRNTHRDTETERSQVRMMVQLVLLYKAPLLHASLSLFLAFFIAFFRLPILFLYALQTYIHPDAQPSTSNGLRAAIRRPSAPEGPAPDLRKRSKNKDKLDFDEKNAQIFRLRLDHAHLQSRLYIDQYCVAFTVSFVTLSSLFLHSYLGSDTNSGFFVSGAFVPILLSSLSLYMWVMMLARLTFERSASRRSEKQLSVLFGIFGIFLGILGLDHTSSLLLDLHFAGLDGFWKVLLAAFMGFLSLVLFIPAARIARSFWLGTDQIHCNLSMITCGWFGRTILYANQLFVIFTALIWIKPLAEIFVNNSNFNNNNSKGGSEVGNAEKLLGNMGFSPSDFGNFRWWCLFGSSLLQIVALRPSLQMYLNEALLSWYQRLHASKVPDLDYSRAKMFLHNHYLCLVVLQFLGPPVLVLLFLGLSQIDVPSIANLPLLSDLLPSSTLVKEVALFLSWWITFLYAIFSSVMLLLHRHCVLYIS